MRSSLGLVLAAGLAVAACESSGEVDPPPAVESTTTVTTGATSTSPDTAAASELPNVTNVVFDGETCTVSGPTSVSAGQHYFVMSDLSDLYVELYVSTLLDGHTFQDLLDLQPEPGIYYPKPSWVVYATKAYGEPSGRTLAAGEIEQEYTLDQSGHEHAIYVGPSNGLWFCSALEVTDAE